jgi:hypothetical protein
MPPVSEWIRPSVLAALAAMTLSGCGERAAGESATAERTARVSANGSTCLPVEDMTTAMGTPVTFTQSIGSICQYELTGSYRGVFIELTTQPASRAEDVFADMRRVVKGMKGQEATPDRVDLGEGGWAFGSGGMSRAAVLANGRLYQANMDYMGFETIGNQKDALVRVLELAIR